MTAVTQARHVHAGDIIDIGGVAVYVNGKRTVSAAGRVAITWKRGSRSGVRACPGTAAVTCFWHPGRASVCISCEQANNGLSRGRHCGSCSCCRKRPRFTEAAS